MAYKTVYTDNIDYPDRYFRAYMEYQVTNNTSTYVIDVKYGIALHSGYVSASYDSYTDRYVAVSTKWKNSSSYYSDTGWVQDKTALSGSGSNWWHQTGTTKITITKTNTARDLTLTIWGHTSVGNQTRYTKSVALTVPALSTYEVSYNGNGDGDTVNSVPGVQTKEYNKPLTLSSTKPTRTGYEFSKWNTKADGSGTSYSLGGSYTSNAPVTLYAQWTAHSYTIKFDAHNGSGSMSSLSMKYGTGKTLPANTFTRTGYTFKNWNTKADGSGTSYSDGARVNKLTSDDGKTVTLYAQWTPNVYTITLNKNGGSNGTSTIYVKYDTGWYSNSSATTSILSVTIPEYTDKEFKGYYTAKSGGTQIIYSNGNLVAGHLSTFTANTTLYAHWSADTCTIHYHYIGSDKKVKSVSETVPFSTTGDLGTIIATKPNYGNYKFSGYWQSISVNSIPTDATQFKTTDLVSGESYTEFFTKYPTNWEKDHDYHYKAVYKRTTTSAGKTTYSSCKFIRSDLLITPQEFDEKTFESYDSDTGTYLCGYIKFNSTYASNLTGLHNLTGPISTLQGIKPSGNVSCSISGITSSNIHKTILFTNKAVYIYIYVNNTSPRLNYTFLCTLSQVLNDFGVTVNFDGNISLSTIIYSINCILDINADGSVVAIGSNATDNISEISSYTGIRTITSNNVTTTQQQQIDPYRITAFYNPIYVSNINNDLIPAITEGRIEDEVVLSSATILRWKQLLGL